MTKKIIAVDLIFPDVVHFFGPRPNHKHSTHPKRQKLRGKIRLITSRPTKLHLVEIKFKGWTHLHWRDPAKSQHSLLVEKMHGYKTIRKTKNVLLQDATVPAGVTDLGFEVTIPGYLCPSFKSESMEIQYILSAKIYPGGKFEKEVQVQKEVAIHKTLMPKDVSSGQVTGYVVPRRTMMGSRKDYVGWEFKVPKWVCLENKQGIVFDGLFRSLGGTVRIEKIAVDVVQEELYHQEGGELDATKRQLTVCSNAPSTYLYPPLSTTIGFSFPLQNSIEGHHGNLTYSLESPFLAIRHFIRLLIHMTDTHTPICVGLPIEISQELMSFFPESDGLPTYQSIARDGERLPDYTRIMMDEEEMEEEEEEVVEEEDEEVDVTDRSPPPQQQQEQQEQQEQRQPRRRRKRQDETMVILERTLDDFGLIKS